MCTAHVLYTKPSRWCYINGMNRKVFTVALPPINTIPRVRLPIKLQTPAQRSEIPRNTDSIAPVVHLVLEVRQRHVNRKKGTLNLLYFCNKKFEKLRYLSSLYNCASNYTTINR